MFHDIGQTIRASLTDDEAFLALELGVLDDFASSCHESAFDPVRNEHLQYLNALHLRGEDVLGLELIDHVLDSISGSQLPDPCAVPLAEILVLKATMLVATGAPTEAEAVLRRAAKASFCPEMTGEIGIRLADVLAGSSRKAEALIVLQTTHDSLTPEERPAALVASLASAYAGSGDQAQAERLLRTQIRILQESHDRSQAGEAALCRVHLASLLLARGECSEIEDLIRPLSRVGSAIPQPLVDLACYFTAVCAAATSGKLLSDCLESSPFLSQLEGHEKFDRLFGEFEWIRPGLSSKSDLAQVSPRSLIADPAYLGHLFNLEDLVLQGSAYRRLAQGDFPGAADDFQSLKELRTGTPRQGSLIAALDMNAFALSLGKAGRSGGLTAARCARRRLQLLLGLRSVGTLRAVLDEAQLLMDQDEPASAGALVRQIVTHQHTSDGGRGQEVLLRLRLVLTEVHTRTGLANQSLRAISSLESKAAELQSVAPDLLLIVRYQAAAARAATGDLDAAEHEFDALRRALESSPDENPELAFNATYGLAKVLQRRGEYTHALSLFKPLLESGLKMSRPLSLRLRRRVAACLMSLHDHVAAADVYRSCADDLKEWAGEGSPDYLDMHLSQADCLLASGQYRRASGIYQTINDALRDGYTGREIFYLRSMTGSAASLRRLQDYPAAAYAYRQVHNFPERAQHISPEATLDLEKWLAWSLEMSGDTTAAVWHYAEAIRILGELYPDRIDLQGELRLRMLCCSE